MKVITFIGSARKNHIYNASKQFLQNLQSLGDLEYEIVGSSNYNLETYKGCKLCINKGEKFCPLKSDKDNLLKNDKYLHRKSSPS